MTPPQSPGSTPSTAGEGEGPRAYNLTNVRRAWSPLAASWLLMALELPVVSAVVARLVNPEIELAAYGSVIMAIALVVEAPIIMLLSASTALSRDRASYRELRRFTNVAGAALTALHLLIALTPLYDVVVARWIAAPEPVVEAARLGLLIMTPWSWAIAYRRFNQGVLIRFGHSGAITIGTMLRLTTGVSVLAIGWWLGSISGAVLASTAVASGVTVEAIYAGLRVRPVVREHLQVDDPEHTPLRGRSFLAFYAPLALTPILSLLAQPLTSLGLARMPDALHSLAASPVVIGLLFMFQALGLAMMEVIVAGLDRPGAARPLWRFTGLLALFSAGGVALLALTPLSRVWFGAVSGLTPELVELCRGALLLGVPIAPLRALISWYSGVLVHARQTRAISESVAVFLITATSVLVVGVLTQRWVGIYVAIAAYSAGHLCQTVWIGWRSRSHVRALLS